MSTTIWQNPKQQPPWTSSWLKFTPQHWQWAVHPTTESTASEDIVALFGISADLECHINLSYYPGEESNLGLKNKVSLHTEEKPHLGLITWVHQKSKKFWK
jgi:hypothetical protein